MEVPKATEDAMQNSGYESDLQRISSHGDGDKQSIGGILELDNPLEIENRSSQEEDNISLDSHDKL